MKRRSFILSSTAALALSGCGGGASGGGQVTPPPTTDDAFIAELQQRTFQWFWDQTPAATGLTPDRWPTPSFCSIAAVGFALTAYGIGVERGWVSRDAALTRTLNTLRFFANAPQGDAAHGVSGYRGFFYHFLDAQTGTRFGTTELSTIDTTLLMGGVLFAAGYFDRDTAQEAEVRQLAQTLYERVEWNWPTPRAPLVSMGWTPEDGFIASDWDIYNEATLLHILGLGSPTHPLADGTWQAVTQRFEPQWQTLYGQTYLHFPPLFGHQYSHVWIDFRGIKDAFMTGKGIDYFENSRRATYAQQGYAVANAGHFRDYGADVFGITACDGPGDFQRTLDGRPYEFFSYSGRGPGDRDDGTLAPTALAGSLPFASEITLPALKHMHAVYGDAIYTRYGFVDAFNPTLRDAAAPITTGHIVDGVGWVDVDYLGIDQGPIVCMIENWRSGLIWNVMRRSEPIRRGLQRAGLSGGWLAG